ncbi:MAG: zinc ribbon domain-containing protein [Thermodesulfovibrionales bacterium]|nr:zinc ribbon domain-containing protein [Thermodesulfovibrionales bacterium]
MPIFEYKCCSCGLEFEKLVFGDQKTICPKCESRDVKKKPSVFGMSGINNPTSSGCTSCSSSSCSTCK